MERELQRVERFAIAWHSGRWELSTLPDALDLRVVVFPGGGEVIGVSLLSVNGIGLSDRLERSPLRLAVQAHECVHHLLELSTTALCNTSWYPVRDELLAWVGAGILIVSSDQDRDLRRGGVSAAELAEACGVPAPLIILGAAAHAQRRGNSSLLGPALAEWCAEMQRLVRLL